MADKITTSSYANFEWLFTDGDTRTQKIMNPKATIETSEITSLETLILNGGGSAPTLFIGDKAGSSFRRINKVTKITETTNELDLN